ncbi:hypothetical protein I6N95_01850 [Vagococcus sp. BWB3-3]|uniref:Uncharacterized protein n=1 Tax=Vagococcus allomyrinae TaxID=2794353 RepID=A0A940PBM8_9ENTE|nr:hypothetical protein [Vagococcus allomyrinae]MBP1039743.1 hypothetical protein [Vagococcus allomyrinae]
MNERVCSYETNQKRLVVLGWRLTARSCPSRDLSGELGIVPGFGKGC